MNAQQALYVHRATKAKEIFGPRFALALVLYPALIGFLLLGRLGAFNLLIPTPTLPAGSAPPSSHSRLHGQYDLWETADDGAITRTSCAFIAVAAVNLYITFHFLMRGVPGSWYIKPTLSWIAPVMLWLVTTAFYLTYVSLARYNAHRGEWGAAAGFSAFILCVTIVMWACPYRANDVLEMEEDPAAA